MIENCRVCGRLTRVFLIFKRVASHQGRVELLGKSITCHIAWKNQRTQYHIPFLSNISLSSFAARLLSISLSISLSTSLSLSLSVLSSTLISSPVLPSPAKGLSHPLNPINLPSLLLFTSTGAAISHTTGQGYHLVHSHGVL